MNSINPEDAKVSYEDQTLPAINLISKLQTQLRDAASRITAIAETLGDLQTALLNSHSEPIPPSDPEPQAAEQSIQEQPLAAETPIKKKLISKCPSCQSLIDLPEASNDLWPVELKCGNCGSKCFVKPSFRKP